MEDYFPFPSFFYVVCLTFIIVAALHACKVKKKRHAPGPWGFPIIGHLPLLGQTPTSTFQTWRKVYGDVFRIRLGSWDTIVLNGYSTIKEALERHDDVFSGRPDFLSTQIARESRDDEDSIEFGPYNAAYQKQRKLTACALRKFTNTRNGYLQNLIHGEVQSLITELLAHEREPCDVRESISLSVASIIYQILFGKGSGVRNDADFRQMISTQEDFLEFVDNAIDILPWLRYILPNKLARFLAFIHTSDRLTMRKVAEHRANLKKDNLKDVTDVFLAANLPKAVTDKTADVTENRQMITLSDLLGAGFGTMSRTMHWLILYMIAYPDVQRKVQLEIDEVVGQQRLVDVNDRPKLHYTQATILEVMRIKNVAPLGIPHFTSMDTTVNGYDIDKGTVVVINMHSANHDEKIWENPNFFLPERHLDSNNCLRKRSYIIPFGIGRRRCIGEFLAKIEVFLFFTALMQRCSFVRPDADDIDTEPVQQLLISPKPYRVIVKERKS